MAVPNNYIDKIKKDGDSRMISPAADMVRVDNDNFEGTDLDEVLDEVAQAIGEAGEGGYAPPAGGIPKTDLSQDVQTSLDKADTALQSFTETDPTVPSWAKQPTKPTYTAQEVGALPENTTIPSKTSDLENDSGFVTEAVHSVTVETPEDGTVDINVDDDTYTINLNHTHEGMAKLVVCEETSLPASFDSNTIYAVVDDETEPMMIEKLVIRGLEFTGGVPDTGEPMIITPSDESTINLGTNSEGGLTETIQIKGKNLEDDLTVGVSGTGLSLTYGQQTGQSVTIPVGSSGKVSASIDIVFSGWGGTNGSLDISSGNNLLSSATIVAASDIPSEYTRLEYVDNINNGLLTDVDAVVSKSPFVGTTWEVDVQMASSSSTNIILCSNGDIGHWFGSLSDGKYGIGSTAQGFTFSQPVTTRSVFNIEFISLGLKVTCNGTTLTRTNANGYNHWGSTSGIIFKVSLLDELNGPTANVKYTGKVYSIKCTSGGSFNGVPAQRISDGKKGLYDKANNVFHPLTT